MGAVKGVKIVQKYGLTLLKLIWQGVVVIIAYYIISNLIVYIVCGVIGMVAFSFYQDYHKRK